MHPGNGRWRRKQSVERRGACRTLWGIKPSFMGQNYIFQIVDPTNPTGPKIDAILPHGVYLNAFKYTPVVYENLRAAKFVLENPERVFSGIRAFNDGGWCFTGRPAVWHVRETMTAPFPDNLVFAVYLNPGMRVYEWRAEEGAKNDPNCPLDWENRYNALIWKRIS
jgi:hypothetical protein